MFGTASATRSGLISAKKGAEMTKAQVIKYASIIAGVMVGFAVYDKYFAA